MTKWYRNARVGTKRHINDPYQKPVPAKTREKGILVFRRMFPEPLPLWLWTSIWLAECAVLSLVFCWRHGPGTACAIASLLGCLGGLIYLYALARRKNLGWRAGAATVYYSAIPISIALAAFAPPTLLSRPLTVLVAIVVAVGNATLAHWFVKNLPGGWSTPVWEETEPATTVTRNARDNHRSSLPLF